MPLPCLNRSPWSRALARLTWVHSLCLALVCALPGHAFSLQENEPRTSHDWPALDGVGTGGPSTGGAGAPDRDVAAWSIWWALNRDGYLPRFPRVFDGGVAPAGSAASPGQRPGKGLRYEVVTPILLDALRNERDDEMKVACLMAVARIGEAPQPSTRPALVDAIRPFLADRNQDVHETAVVALGVLGGREAVRTLTELVHDTSDGRRILRRGRVSVRVRALAAYAIGLVGAQALGPSERMYCAHVLRQALAEDESPNQDLGVACVISLGLLPLELARVPKVTSGGASTRQGQVEFLLEVLGDRKVHRRVRAQAPVAIARLVPALDVELQARVIDVFLEMLAPKAHATEAERHGLVQALGRLGDDDEDGHDVAIRARLLEIAKDGKRLERYLALIALAEVAGRPGAGDPGDAITSTRSFLVKRSLEGTSTERPWAVLATGLLERAREALGDPPAAGTRMFMVKRHAEAKSPSESAAYAIAFGLMYEVDALEALRKQAGKGSERSRGAAMLALGWMSDTAERDMILHTLIERGPPSLSREAAISLALMQDKHSVDSVAQSMTMSRFVSVRIARILALGYLGDARAVAPLVALIQSKREPARIRAWTAASLGIICDKWPVTWNARLAEDVVWWDVPPTLLDPEGARGILDRL
jgi:HEAT repeat protein